MQQRGLLVGVKVARQEMLVVVDIAVDDERVGPAVAVEIGQHASPADPREAVVPEALRLGAVLKHSVSQVDEQADALAPVVGDEAARAGRRR